MRIKDRLLLSGLSGGLAAIVANFFLYGVNLFLPGNNINMPEATAEFFLNINPGHIDWVTRILGFIWSMTIGGFYALLFIVALDLTGWISLTTKAVFTVTGGWLIGIGLLLKLVSVAQYVRDEPLSIAAFYVAHLVFAVTLSYLVKSLGEQ